MAGEQRWLFTKDELLNTPSRKAGIDAEKELTYRQQCANLVQDMGQKLQVTQLCINTAIVYMHRFYMFHSFSKFHRNPMGAACLFLAAKVEEQPRKLEHVIRAYHVCVNRDQGSLDVKSEAYLELAQECVVNENILLQTLGFSISVEHPHAMVVKTCTLVKASKDLAQTSYFLATNSLHLTTMSLKYSHTVVACVCIHLACKWSTYQIPRSTEGKEWYEYVDKKITKDMLERLTQEFLQILDNCPSKLKKKILTWKSGGKSIEDQANPGGDPSKRSSHTEATHSPHHALRHPIPSTSGATDKDAVDSSMRRSRTEPVLGHKEYLDRKQRERARLQQKQGMPSGHAPPPSSGGPTHPPPKSSRPTHPPPSRRPQGHHTQQTHPASASQAAPPHHRNIAPEDRKPSDAPPATGHSMDRGGRSNIFDQLQHERGQIGAKTEATTQDAAAASSHYGHTNKSHGGHNQPPPSHHHHTTKGHSHHGPAQPPSAEKPGHLPGQPLPHSSSSHSSARDKNQQASSRQKPERVKPEVPHNHQRPTAEPKPDHRPHASVPKAVYSKTAQDFSEKSMMEKLQSEIQNQSSRVKHSSSNKRQSPEKLPSELKSPPSVKRQKSSGSSGSRSGSDGTNVDNVKERIRAVQEIKEKMIQEDQKRLRRVSEELGDDRLKEKAVVMLDNVFTSPQSVISPEKNLLSPGLKPADPATNAGNSVQLKAGDTVDGGKRQQLSVTSHKTTHSPHASASQAQAPTQANSTHRSSSHQHGASQKTEGHGLHRHSDSKSDPALVAAKQAELSKAQVKREHIEVKTEQSSKVHVKKEHGEIKTETTETIKHTVKKEIKQETASDYKPDVSEILKNIGRKEEPAPRRKEDFYRIGPPRELKKEPVEDSQSDKSASHGVDEGKEGLNRNKSTISLEKYRKRRPLTPSQDKSSPSTNKTDSSLSENATINLKDTEMLGLSFGLSGFNASPHGLANKEIDVTSLVSGSKISEPKMNKEPNLTPNISPLVEFSIGSPAKNLPYEEKKNLASDAKTLLRSKQEKLVKLNARIEKPPERQISSNIDMSPNSYADSLLDQPVNPAKSKSDSKQIPVEKTPTSQHDVQLKTSKQSAPTLIPQLGHLTEASMPGEITKIESKVTVTQKTYVSSPSVEPGEIIEENTGTESPSVKSLGLKIKLGDKVMVTSMSPKPDEAKAQHSHHHHKEKKHKHKHKHKKSHDREKDRDREKRHHHKDSLGDSGSSNELKMKLNLKHLAQGGSESPLVQDSTAAASGDVSQNTSSAPQPMKLVLSKDKTGQYSSGHKHKHSSSSSSRKRTHSPAESDRQASAPVAKVARSDTSAMAGSSNGGSKPASPHGDKLEKTRQGSASLERILYSQKKTLGKLKDKPATGQAARKNKSPLGLPASYQNPNPDV